MPYPKPLSEKTIARMYRESGLTDAALDFLHTLFEACSNLYGAISLRKVWSLYLKLEGIPKLKRKEFLAFSSIARREEQSYTIWEENELFTEAKPSEIERILVNRQLVGFGYYWYSDIYEVVESSVQYEVYAPTDHLLSWVDPKPSPQESALMTYISSLKSTADECVPEYGLPRPNENKGRKLGQFSFMSAMDIVEAEMLPKSQRAHDMFDRDMAGSEAEKIMRQIKRYINLGRLTPNGILKWMTSELHEVGVVIGLDDLQHLFNLFIEFYNNCHMWCMAGWSPNLLHATAMG